MPTYENVQFTDEKKDAEGLYTIGRRFPSIRIKGKKEGKKKAINQQDTEIEVNHQSGSCVTAVTAIYAYHEKNSQYTEENNSNIYENGHIVLKQEKKQQNKSSCCLCQFLKAKKSKILLFIMVVSVISFVMTGGWLLYVSGM